MSDVIKVGNRVRHIVNDADGRPNRGMVLAVGPDWTFVKADGRGNEGWNTRCCRRIEPDVPQAKYSVGQEVKVACESNRIVKVQRIFIGYQCNGLHYEESELELVPACPTCGKEIYDD